MYCVDTFAPTFRIFLKDFKNTKVPGSAIVYTVLSVDIKSLKFHMIVLVLRHEIESSSGLSKVHINCKQYFLTFELYNHVCEVSRSNPSR